MKKIDSFGCSLYLSFNEHGNGRPSSPFIVHNLFSPERASFYVATSATRDCLPWNSMARNRYHSERHSLLEEDWTRCLVVNSTPATQIKPTGDMKLELDVYRQASCGVRVAWCKVWRKTERPGTVRLTGSSSWNQHILELHQRIQRFCKLLHRSKLWRPGGRV